MEKLKLISGDPYYVNDNMTIQNPTLEDIRVYGEQEYWQLVSMICSTSYDIRFNLDDMGIDYEDIEDFTVFCMIVPNMTPQETGILFGEFDFSKLSFKTDETEVFLEGKNGVVIDRVIYELIVHHIRELNGLKRNYKVAGNKKARRFYMEEERKILERKIKENAGKPPESTLEPLISALVNNADFKYDYTNVWSLPIYTLFDSAKRISKIVNYRNLMNGIYTGNVDSKKIPKKQMDWMGDL
ncbi:hypothetical protein AALA22_08860 [Anaerovoracaceae bacterium 41-7]